MLKRLYKLFKENNLYSDTLFLTIIIGIIYGIFLGSYALVTPDEARYAEIAREMVQNNQWITPHLNHILYFEKPILFYWLEGFAIKLLGLSEWSLRFWPAYLASFGCIITYIAGRKLYDRTIGILASLILATSALYFIMGHLITLDMAVTAFITATLFAFLLALQKPIGWPRRRYMWLAAACSALALLTKGWIGLAFPCIIIGIWVLLLNKWRELKNWHIPSAILIFLIVALPWHIAIQLKHHSFAYFYFIEQQFIRYTTLSAARYEPTYFYLLVWIAALFPWSVFLIQSMIHAWPRWKKRHENETSAFLFIWVFAILIFFSISHSQLIPYILPILPPSALLISCYLTSENMRITFWKKIGFSMLPIIGLILGSIIIIIPHYYPVAQPHLVYKYLLTTAIIMMFTFALAYLFFHNISMKSALIILIAGTSIYSISILPGISTIDHRSIKPLALDIAAIKKPNDLVVAYDHYYQDLPFYLRQKIIVVNWFQNELKFGIEHQKNARDWMITNEQFWKMWKANKERIFVVTRHSNYIEIRQNHPKFKGYLLGVTQRNILLSNRNL